jgi:hypothetical protein
VTAAPIKYDQPVANFIAGLDATEHVTHRSYEKTSVTFHHNGGRLSLAGILEVWKTRRASAHFQVDGGGRVGQYVGVQEYAWATGNTQGNISSISIEMANLSLAPKWEVSTVTWRSAARLAGWLFANVIKGRPRPTRANVHVHHFWKSTDCAGPYIDRVFEDLLLEVQTWYIFFMQQKSQPTDPTPSNDWEAIMALFNTKEEFIEAQAQGTERGLDRYFARFLKDEQGTGDTILDDVKAHRVAELARLDQIAKNTAPKV